MATPTGCFGGSTNETLIGRFYLMHPIGVRPETTDFEIGSSFDYSFIPEMCPSGQVLTLVDSDEYFIVEMQKRDHDARNLLPGPLGKAEFANQLSEWTTAQHRENAAHTVVFHAADVPATLGAAVAEADRYIASVAELLSPEPQPYRGHHYWIGSIAVNRARTGRALSREDWQVRYEESLPTSRLARLPGRLRHTIFGSLPEVTWLHPRWPDYQLLHAVLKQAMAEGRRLLIVAEEPRIFAHWLTRTPTDAATIAIDRILGASPHKYRSLFQPLAGEFAACVVLLPEVQFHHSGGLLERIEPLLAPGGQISIVAMNERPVSKASGFVQVFASHSSRLLDLSAWIVDARYVPADRLRWRTYRALRWFADHAGRFTLASTALLGLPLCVPLALVSFLTSVWVKPRRFPPRLASSIMVQLRRSERESHLPWHHAERRVGRVPAPSAGPTPLAAVIGTNCPADVLAKYGFVSGLLERRSDVAAYGCLDSFGTKMVLDKVKKLSVYDPDPSRINEISTNISDSSRFDATVHDILDNPLPAVHDAIYNFDTFEYVSPSDEVLYLRNLTQSLSRRQDILILGLALCDADGNATADAANAPFQSDLALASSDLRPFGPRQTHYPEKPQAPLIPRTRYRRTSAGVKALLEGQFRTVSLFSMTSGVLQAGTSDEGDYLFALCSSKKD